MFDSIIENAKREVGFAGDTAGAILAALLGYMTSPGEGGFSGFLDKFRSAGLGSSVDSWISGATGDAVSAGDVSAALGDEAVATIAADAGVDSETAARGIAAMLPNVVDKLTPDAEVPDDDSVMSKIGGFLADWGGVIGGAVVGGATAAAAVAGKAADTVGDAADATIDKGKQVLGSGINAMKNVGGSVSGGGDDSGATSHLNSLLLLIPLLFMIALGYFACGQTKDASHTNTKTADKPATNAAAKSVDSSFAIKAVDGKYTVTGVVPDEAAKKKIVDALTAQFGTENVNFDGLKVDANAKPFAAGWWENFAKMLPDLKDWKTGSLAFAGTAITDATGLPAAALDKLKSLFSGWTMPNASATESGADRSLTDVSLPNGEKLQAFPGGIEDQLVKFVSSDEFGAATADSLGNKWFNFDDLTFKFGTSELDESSKRQLDNIVAILKAFPNVKIKIGGYTDKKGDDAANLKLSDSRAKAVKAALDKAGVGAQVPEAEGYGEKFATVDENASDEARKVDRRTAIRLIK